MKKLTTSICIILGLALAQQLNAAQIQWVSQPFTDVKQLKYIASDFIGAYNFGSASDLTVNGVEFTGNNGASQDDADFQFGNGGAKLNFSAADVYQGAAITGLDAADTATLLDSFSYRSAAGAGYLMTLKNLTPGLGYRIQTLLVDDRAGGGIPDRRMHFSPDNTAWGPIYDYTSTGNALLMTGTFVADGTTQQFRQGIQGTGAPQMNAFSFSASAYVPEPSTSMYLCLGVMLMSFGRRVAKERQVRKAAA